MDATDLNPRYGHSSCKDLGAQWCLGRWGMGRMAGFSEKWGWE